MADLIQREDSLNKGRVKLNEAIKQSERAEDKADTATVRSITAKETADTTRDEMQDIIREQTNGGDIVPEVVQARGSETTLGSRLNSVDSQLAQTGMDIGDILKLGTHARSLSQSLSERATNVKDYGAKGDSITEDSQAFIDAVNDSDGYVYVPPGNYIVEGLPLKDGLHYFGAGVGATQLTLPNVPTNHMFVAEGEGISGGSVKDMYLLGSRAGSTSDFNGLDFSSMSTLDLFTLENCLIRRFDIGYNGTDNDRWAYLTNCRIYDNRIGIRAGEHPILTGLDVRFNDIGMTGGFNDLKAQLCNFNYNRVGVQPETGRYINNSLFVLCAFWRNTERACSVTSNNSFTSCRFTGNDSDDEGLVLNNAENSINGCRFNQSSTGFAKGAIIFTSSASRRTSITNNDFKLTKGAGIVANTVVDTAFMVISGNTVTSINYPFIKGNPDRNFTEAIITGNQFSLDSELNGSLIEIPKTSNGFVFSGNHVKGGYSGSFNYILDVSILNSTIKDNHFHVPSGVADKVLNIVSSNSTTIVKDNKGIKTVEYGTAVIPTGETKVTVNHTLIGRPSLNGITITPTNRTGALAGYYPSNTTSNSFEINIAEEAPSPRPFSWKAEVFN